jgi:hypothetical protein
MTDQPMSEEPMSWEIRDGGCREVMASMAASSVDEMHAQIVSIGSVVYLLDLDGDLTVDRILELPL